MAYPGVPICDRRHTGSNTNAQTSMSALLISCPTQDASAFRRCGFDGKDGAGLRSRKYPRARAKLCQDNPAC